MKILLIKNTATQSISYILKAIKRKAPEAKLYVLAHEHTVDAMSQFQEVHKVIPYTPKDIFQYKKIDATTLNYFEKNKFDKIYFYHNRDAKAHFENVLFIARKLVSSGGKSSVSTLTEMNFFLLPGNTRKYVPSGILHIFW